MQRREFLKASLAVGAASLLAGERAQAMESDTRKREYYELRRITFGGAAQQERYLAYLKDAYLPALKRLNNSPVGVFTLVETPETKDKPDALTVYVLIPYATVEACVTLSQRMATDEAYKAAGAFLQNLPSSDPPYTRTESWLLHAFESYPTLHVPTETAQSKGRTFELRTYESHSRKAGQKKIEMFNVGETAIFVRGGFQPVFFGENIIGSGMPSLTYMVTYADGTPRADYWAKFGADPEKARLFALPEYADKEIVSKIHAVMLRPTAFSQI